MTVYEFTYQIIARFYTEAKTGELFLALKIKIIRKIAPTTYKTQSILKRTILIIFPAQVQPGFALGIYKVTTNRDNIP